MMIFRMACLSALLAGVAFTTGCATECHNERDPATGETHRVCHAENLKRYEGQSQAMSIDYPAGHDILIDGVNGNVDVSVGSSQTVEVTFFPFSYRGNDEADKQVAIEDMENDLELALTDNGTAIFVDTGRTSGSNDGLGADMQIKLPPGYTGAIEINPGNGFVEGNLGGSQASTKIINEGTGDIDVTNAAGQLQIRGDFDVNVSVSSWAASGQNGDVTSISGGLGNVVLSLPANSIGSIQAVAEEGPVTGPAAASGWEETIAAENSKTYTFGGGAGALVTVGAPETIVIEAR